MTLLSSLTNRIFLASAMLAIATTGVAVYVVGTRVTREAERRTAARPRRRRRRWSRSSSGRWSPTTRSSRGCSPTCPKLKSAVATQDPITVQPIAADYRQQVGADLLLVTGRTGPCSRAAASRRRDPSRRHGAPRARGAGGARVPAAIPRGILQVITVPISIGLAEPDVLGTLSLGVRARRAACRPSSSAARSSEIAFVLDGRVRAATLPPPTWPALATLRRADRRGSLTVGRRRIRWAVALPLRPSSDPGAGADRRRGRGRAGPAVAHRAAPVPSHGQHGAGRRRVRRRAARDGPELRRRANRHAPARRDHRHDARSGDDRRPDAEDHAARTGAVPGRGRAPARQHLQHADRLDRALPARGDAEGSAARRSAGCQRSSRTKCATR